MMGLWPLLLKHCIRPGSVNPISTVNKSKWVSATNKMTELSADWSDNARLFQWQQWTTHWTPLTRAPSQSPAPPRGVTPRNSDCCLLVDSRVISWLCRMRHCQSQLNVLITVGGGGRRRRRALKQTVYCTVTRPSSSWRRAPIKRLDQIHEYRHQWWISALWITQDINLQRHRPILNSWLDVFADASSSAQSSSSTLRFFEVL